MLLLCAIQFPVSAQFRANFMTGMANYKGDLQQKEVTLENLIWMCQTIMANIDSYPVDKQGRWIGFVQGVLACKGILSVANERDRTRPFFHEAYAKTDQVVPPTLNMPQD